MSPLILADPPHLDLKERAPDLDIDVLAPDLDIEVLAPNLDIEVLAPDLDLEVPTPNLDLDVPTPNLDLDVPTPNLDLDVATPLLDLKVTIPYLDLKVTIPYLDLKVAALDLDLKVGARDMDLEIPSPNLDLEVLLPHLDLEVTVPHLDLKVAIPNLDLEVGVPNLDVEVGGPDLDLEVGGPDLDLEVGGLDLDLEVGAPDLEVGAPDLDLEIITPNSDLEVVAPDLDLEVGAPNLDLEVPTPNLDLEVETPHLDLEVIAPYLDLEVIAPYLDLEVATPDLDLEVGAPDLDLEITTPNLDLEVVAPDLNLKVAALDRDLEVPAPDLNLEVAALDKDLEVPAPNLDLEVTTPHLDLEVATPHLDLEVGAADLNLKVASHDLDLKVASHDLDLRVAALDLDLAVVAPHLDLAIASRGALSTEPSESLINYGVAQAIFSHFINVLPMRKIVQLKNVNNKWATFICDNLTDGAEAYWNKGEIRDWYFPLRFNPHLHGLDYLDSRYLNIANPKHRWRWSGFHEPSGALHALPCLHKHRPHKLSRDVRCLLAISGGLLLLSDRPLTGKLLVWNPVTQQNRVLPAHKCHDVERAQIVVDEKEQCYKLILISRDYVYVYKSTTKRWNSGRFSEPIPCSLGGAACTIMNGKLYFAELETAGNVVRTFRDMQAHTNLNIYEVDDEAGTWSLLARYSLGDCLAEAVRREWFTNGSHTIALTECMGSLYAVIYSGFDFNKFAHLKHLGAENILHAANVKYNRYRHYGYIPMQFYVIKVNGGVVDQLLVRPHPVLGKENMPGKNHKRFSTGRWPGDWFFIPKNDPTKNTSWFECSAHGSVIWVAFDEFLLSYDVGSSQTKTRILPNTLGNSRRGHPPCAPPWFLSDRCFAFSPSFNQHP